MGHGTALPIACTEGFLIRFTLKFALEYRAD